MIRKRYCQPSLVPVFLGLIGSGFTIAGIALVPVTAMARPQDSVHTEPQPSDMAYKPGSLATTAPLGPSRIGMSLGGGVAVLLPFYALEMGIGVGPNVDLVGRFESVIGVLHYPRLGVRWAPLRIKSWKIGIGLGINYSFFGIATDNLNLSSTLYFDTEAGISGPITANTDLFFMIDSEVDVLEHNVLDGQAQTDGTFRYDATIFKLGIKTKLTDDLNGYLRGRLRVPTETFTYEAMYFYVIPSIEIGGTWSF